MNHSKITRRRMLHHGACALAAAVAAPIVLPGRVLGRNGAVPPSERICMGFTGLGGQGSGHLFGGAWTYLARRLSGPPGCPGAGRVRRSAFARRRCQAAGRAALPGAIRHRWATTPGVDSLRRLSPDDPARRHRCRPDRRFVPCSRLSWPCWPRGRARTFIAKSRPASRFAGDVRWSKRSSGTDGSSRRALSSGRSTRASSAAQSNVGARRRDRHAQDRLRLPTRRRIFGSRPASRLGSRDPAGCQLGRLCRPACPGSRSTATPADTGSAGAISIGASIITTSSNGASAPTTRDRSRSLCRTANLVFKYANGVEVVGGPVSRRGLGFPAERALSAPTAGSSFIATD
jgi:hypothetical protein